MTLADSLFAARGTDNDLAGCVTSLTDSIAKAERFCLDDDVALAGYQVIRSRPASMLSGLLLCRAPYQNVWLEWNGSIALKEGFAAPPDEFHPVPSKLGCLIEAVDKEGQRGVMTWAWKHPGDKGICVCGVSIAFDWSPTAKFNTDLDDKGVVTLMRSNSDWAKYISDPEQREAVRLLVRHETLTISPHIIDLIAIGAKRSPLGTQKLLKSWAKDISGEAPFVTAILMLMNSRNAVEHQRTDLKRLNHARKKRGKPPLLSHVTTRLHLSTMRARAADADGITRAAARAHMVRGHFKIRKSGIYWWSPFKRGDPNHPVPRKEYVVT